MPSYDAAFRTDSISGQQGQRLWSGGGTSSAPVPKVTGTVNGDLVIVTGRVNNGAQINAPDVTWTRLVPSNNAQQPSTSEYQAFWKRASGEPATWTFTWDGIQRPYEFNSFSAYSQAGGTISIDTFAKHTDTVNANSTVSDAVTPSQNAVVMVNFQEFVSGMPGPPSGPVALTAILTTGGIQPEATTWSGIIGIPANTSSGTFTCANNSGDPNDPFRWSSGTFALISSIPNPLLPPFIDDELVFQPTVKGAAASVTLIVPFIDDELVFTPVVVSANLRPVIPVSAHKLGIQIINGGGWIVQGSTRVVRVQLTDLTGVYVTDRPVGTPAPLGPPAGVLITLVSPSQRKIVSQAPMSPDPNITGNYYYMYNVALNDEIGRWLAQFYFYDGMGNTGLAPPRPLWTVTTQ